MGRPVAVQNSKWSNYKKKNSFLLPVCVFFFLALMKCAVVSWYRLVDEELGIAVDLKQYVVVWSIIWQLLTMHACFSK